MATTVFSKPISDDIANLSDVHIISFTPNPLPSRLTNWVGMEIRLCGNMCNIYFTFGVNHNKSASSGYEQIGIIDISDYFEADEERISNGTAAHIPITDSSNGVMLMSVGVTSNKEIDVSMFQYGSTGGSGIHMVRGILTFPYKRKIQA